MPTKVLQINLKLKTSVLEYHSLCQSLAQTFAAIPGLCWKIWILNDRQKEAGGIYFFESEHALNDFLSSPLAAQVKSHPALFDFSAKVFDVMEEVTAITHGPVAAPATAAINS